jgi:hypothetical protein
LVDCSVILREQNIVQDGVIFIEDKLTSLDFDNAEDQTSTSDEEFEWNDDSGDVSKDVKHMKKNQRRRTKMLLLKKMMMEVVSLNYPQLCYNLKMNSHRSLNYLHQIMMNVLQPLPLMCQEKKRNENKIKQSNQIEDKDTTI